MNGVKLTVVAGVMMLSLTACGGGSSATQATSEAPAGTPSQTTSHSTKPSSAPTPDDQAHLLRTNVQAYSDAYLLYGSPLPIKTFKANIQGNLARVTYTYSVSAINQNQEPWVKEHGKWHEDDC